MSGGLPVTVDPVLLAEKGAELVGRVAVRGMARLRALLLDDSGDAEIDLVFERAEGSGVRRMRGRIAVAAVNATCQRCLEPMVIELVAKPDTLLLREGEREGSLPPEADALVFGQTPTVLAELIEEELLLVMPMVPMHPLDECPARHYLAHGAAAKQSLSKLARTKQE